MTALYSLVTASGTSIALDASNGVVVQQTYGLDMPPVSNQGTDYALLDGASWQRARAGVRVATLQISAIGTSVDGTNGLHKIRAKLVNAVNPHRHGTGAMKLYYTGNSNGTRYLNCRYDSGLEGGDWRGFTETMTLRLLAVDPYWYANTGASSTTPTKEVKDLDRIASWTDGVWSSMGGGAPDAVFVLAAKPGGGVYAGGQFNTIGSTAAMHVASWDGTRWHALGGGVAGTEPNVIVQDLAVAPNGDLYVTGNIFRAGNTAVQNIAVRDISLGRWAALGTGLDASGRALAFDHIGNLYVGGSFNTAGHTAASTIAKWNGSYWSALGAGLSPGTVVHALAVGPDNHLYAGGSFNTAGHTAASTIAKWNGSYWSALGSGIASNKQVLALAYDDVRGYLYAGGTFTTAGGVTCNHVARWNGQQWEPLGGGVNNQVSMILVLASGELLVGGDFTRASGLDVQRVARWNGYQWVGIGGDLAGGIGAAAEDDDGVLYYGGIWHDNKNVSGRKTLTNIGSARAYPIITIAATAASQTLLYIRNDTTDQTLWFNYPLQNGETLTIDCTPGAKSVTSSFYGTRVGDNPLPGSQLATFYLNPGANNISTFVDGASTTVTFTWTPTYWSRD